MHRTTLFTTLFALLLSLVLTSAVGAADPNLVAYWPMDDEGTGMAMDHSGNARHGALFNDAQFVSEGVVGGSIYLDSNGDYVEVGSWTGILGGRARTVTAWIKPTDTDTSAIIGWGPNGPASRMGFRLNESRLRCEHHSGNVQGDTELVDGNWHHVAVVIQENATISHPDVKLFLDGVDDTRASSDPDVFNTTAGPPVTIGRRPSSNDRAFGGFMDDVRVYDRALTDEEIAALAVWPKSHEPKPADGAVLDKGFVILGWEPGGYAEEFDVYISKDRDAVVLGSQEAYQGRQTADFVYIQQLDLGNDYYWRVDDVEADGQTIHPGAVWNFFVPPRTAFSPNPQDGRDYVVPDGLELTWQPAMDPLLYEVYLGESFEQVSNDDRDGPTYMGQEPATSYAPTEPLQAETTYYWRIDTTDTTMQVHKGEVWSFTTIPDVAITDPNLKCWWRLEEDSPYTVLDWSGHGNHGTIMGEPEHVEGFDGMAMNFRGDAYNDSVIKWLDSGGVWPEFTVTLWAKAGAVGQNQYSSVFSNYSPNSAGTQFDVDGTNPGNWRINPPGGTGIFGSVTTQWVHLTIVGEGTTVHGYYNGWWMGSVTVGDGVKTFNKFAIAENRNQDNMWEGIVDDFRVYDYAMTQDEIRQVMRIDPNLAWNPNPPRSRIVDIRDAVELTWSPGDMAMQHDVYFGTDEDAVEDADTGSSEYKGRQDGTTYPLGGLVQFASGPYYWRVDEINSDGTTTKGRVWNFEIGDFLLIDDMEDYNNFSPDTIWEAWADGFGSPSNGSQVGHDLGPTVDAGENYAELGIVHSGDQSMPFYYNNSTTSSFATYSLAGDKRDWNYQGVNTLSLWYRGYAASVASFVEEPGGMYTMVSAGLDIYGTADSFTFAWKNLSGSGSIEARVDSVDYASGGSRAGVMIRDTLDPNSIHAVAKIRADGGIRFNRRTEAAGDTSGDSLGGFATPHWFKLERDFSGNVTASHANDVGGSPDVWEQINTINITMSPNVYIGLATCGNAGGASTTAVFSHVTTTGTVTGDWQYSDIGIQSNVPDEMFITLQDGTGVQQTYSNDDPNAILTETWTELNVPLSEFAGLGMSDVASITLGIGAPGGGGSGGSGIVYFDDVRLYGSRCFPDIVKPTADFSNNCVVDLPDLEILSDDWLIEGYDVTVETASDANLVAYYQFENNLLDSSGNGNTADPCGVVPMYAAGNSGQAIDFDGTYYLDVGGSAGVTGASSRTCSAWIKTATVGEIVSWGVDVGTQKYIFRVQDDNGDEGTIRIEVNGGYICGQTDVRDGQWHHVTAVLDSDGTPDVADIELYVDGVLEVVTAVQASLINTSPDGSIRIGESPWHNRPFTGQIDDLRVYDRALSQGEVANLAGMSVGTVFPQPVVALLTTPEDTDLHDDEKINFKDYAVLIDSWLDEQLWP